MIKRCLMGAVIAISVILIMIEVSALTGSIGNSRMVLRVQTGEVVEKFIFIKNVNDFPLTINLFTSGDLADNIEILDNNFVLNAGEEKRAYFTVHAEEPGITDTKINVQFTPPEGNGVGLIATVVVVAAGDGINVNDESDGSDFTLQPGSARSIDANDENNRSSASRLSFSPEKMLIVSTVLLVILFVVLLFFYVKNESRKKVGGARG